MKVEFTTAYEVDVDHLDPKFVDIRGFAIDEAKRMLHDDIFFGEATDENFDAKIVNEDLYYFMSFIKACVPKLSPFQSKLY